MAKGVFYLIDVEHEGDVQYAKSQIIDNGGTIDKVVWTVVGKGRCTRKHWNLEEYSGKRGKGYRMISSYPHSSNFNSITFFIKQQAA